MYIKNIKLNKLLMKVNNNKIIILSTNKDNKIILSSIKNNKIIHRLITNPNISIVFKDRKINMINTNNNHKNNNKIKENQ